MSTRNVELTEHHEKLIDCLVKSGRYRNASEVIGEGPSLIEQRETLEAAKLEAFRKLPISALPISMKAVMKSSS